MKAIRIYVEGGGESSDGKAAIRRGFGQFLGPLRELARQKRIPWQVVACGSRGSAFRDFRTALKQHPDAFNVLLVDSEGPVQSQAGPWAHLDAHDGWRAPEGTDDTQCHLMVQTVEAWLLADPETLERFYGKGFQRNRLPGTNVVEAIPKEALEPALVKATEGTSKGRYHKIRHCAPLLEQLDASRVRKRSPHCDRLFVVLTQCLMGA